MIEWESKKLIAFVFQCKQPERDQEREQLRRELQHVQNHFSTLHLSSQDVPDGVSEIVEVRIKVEN